MHLQITGLEMMTVYDWSWGPRAFWVPTGYQCKSRLASHSSWIWSESESLGQLENGKIRLVMNCKAELNERGQSG
jgi:hypothetical protein